MNSGSVIHQCPSCTAGLTFDAATQSFVCKYCGGQFTQPQLEEIYAKAEKDMQKIAEQALNDEVKEFSDNNNLYICPTCGAQVMTDSELSASAFCHYCHNPVVLSGRLSGEYRPDKIIPFKKTKQDALNGFQEWIKKRKTFLAKGFAKPETLEKIQGIYVPYWLADFIIDGNMTVECYKTLSSYRVGDHITTVQEKSEAVRQGTAKLTGVPSDSSSKASNILTESIEPFDYSEMIDFNMAYLSGHNAEKYDVTKDMVEQRLTQRAFLQTRDAFSSSIIGNYSRKNIVSSKFDVKEINWTYCLMPLWFLSYNYKGKMYYYAMNGQTGKFGGTLPLNKAKLFLTSYGIGAIIGILFSLFMLLCY